MRRVLRFSVLLFGIFTICSNADARSGGGFGGGFSGGFRGFSGHIGGIAPSFRPFTGFHRGFAGRRPFFPARRLSSSGVSRKAAFSLVTASGGLFGGSATAGP